MVSELLYTGLVLAVAAERLAELKVSRRNARWAFARGAVEAGQGHWRVMQVLHTAFLVACVAEVWLLDRRFSLFGWLALAGVIAAQALRWWAIATLGRRWNVRIIVLPDEQPVTDGPYRLVRHPNYAAVVLELFCLPLVHGAWLTALVFGIANAALLSVRIRAEEEALGPMWQSAFAQAPRFLPGARDE